jgi:hypothetical protein
MADSLHPDIDAFGPVAQGALQLRPHLLQGPGLQTLHLAAGVTLEVGVGRMMLAGQFVVGDPVLDGQAPKQAPVAKIIQDAVNCNFVHPAPGPDGGQNILGPQGPACGSQDLQDRQAQGRGLHPPAGQQLREIAEIAHSW